MSRLTIKTLHDRIGVTPDTPGYGKVFGPRSRKLLTAKLTNLRAPAATRADFIQVAEDLDVPVGHIYGSRTVEAPRGPFDKQGRPTALYERHVFSRNTEPQGRFDRLIPHLSGGPYGRGGYGAFDAQFDKLLDACAYDPEAAFRACSWGAFQVLGENATAIGYASAFDLALSLVESEAAHLRSYAAFIKAEGLQDELRACKSGDPASCEPFVRRYNGKGYKQFNYHVKFAAAI